MSYKLDDVVKMYKPITDKVADKIGSVVKVFSVADISISETEKEILVYFGEIQFPILKEELLKPHTLRSLKALEIDVKRGIKGNLEFYWRGKRVGQ